MVLVGGGGAWPGFETTRRATSATTALLVWSVPEELVGLAAVPVGGGGAWMGFETTRRSTSATTAPLVWWAREELVGLAVVLVGGGGAWPGFETTRRATSATTAPPVWRVPEEFVGLLWCWWAAAGPGWDTHRKDKLHWCGGCRRARRARAGLETRRRTQ